MKQVSSSGDATDVGEAVVAAVADARGVDPTELEQSLYGVVDPDALESLFRSTSAHDRESGYVTFSYSGCEVVVYGDGDVLAERAPSVSDDHATGTPSSTADGD